MADLTGKTVGAYRLTEKLGEGGMSEVYKAYQPRLDRYVAIKFIRPELAADPEFLPRFEQEARALGRLSHPAIVSVFDYGELEGRGYLVMEYLPGGTLKDRLCELRQRGEKMSLKEACQIIRQASEALDYAHQQGIIHRDVKPANIMLVQGGRVVLNDFGIARMIGSDSALTRTGTAIGTPDYMSPEQIEGDTAAIGPASDVYSLGIVLYEMMTGRVPFVADTPLAVMLKHLHDPITLPRTFNPDLSVELERVILKALARRPEDRYARAADLADALEACYTRLSAASATRVATQRAIMSPRVHRLGVGLLLGMIVVALLFLGAEFLLGEGWRPPFKVMNQTTSSPAVLSLQMETKASPLPITLTSTSAPPTQPLTALATVEPAKAEIRITHSILLPVDVKSPNGLSWSEDGFWVTEGEENESFFLFDPSGSLRSTVLSPEVNPSGLVWDGKTLWVSATNNKIYQLMVTVGQPEVITSFDTPGEKTTYTGVNDDLAWDGENLIYAHGYSVYRLDTTGKVLDSFTSPYKISGVDWDGERFWLSVDLFPEELEPKIYIAEPESGLLSSYSSPIDEIHGLSWGEGLLWTVGRNNVDGRCEIIALDVSQAVKELKASKASKASPIRATPTLTLAPEVSPEDLISVKQTLKVPGRIAEGFAWDGSTFWIADNSGVIFQMEPGGKTLGSFAPPDVTPTGMTWDGDGLWLFTTNHWMVYQFKVVGTQVRVSTSFEAPPGVFGGTITHDLSWDGETLWYANQYNVYKFDNSGNVLQSFAFPKNVTGLEWAGEHLWLAAGNFPEQSTLYIVNTQGDVLAAFISPIYEIDALTSVDGGLWALGRDSITGELQLYELDISKALTTLKESKLRVSVSMQRTMVKVKSITGRGKEHGTRTQ